MNQNLKLEGLINLIIFTLILFQIFLNFYNLNILIQFKNVF
jgi:hypothetical protein